MARPSRRHGGCVAPRRAIAAPRPALKDLADWQPQASFEQSFTVNHPVDEVWNFFADTAAVAACLPGASLSGETGARNVSGKMRIKVGPIAAEFHGAAEIDRDPQHAFGHDPGQRPRPAQQLGDAWRHPLSAAAAGRGRNQGRAQRRLSG